MPRPASMEPKVRLNLEITEKSRERIERLMEWFEADSLTETIRRATSLCEQLWELSRNGGRVIVREADGTEREIVTLEMLQTKKKARSTR